jgi:ribosome biogenesis GTPase / thiamine phosphate phosphatase
VSERGAGDAAERGIIVSGTGGVWRVLADSGEMREAALRGRLKRERDRERGAAPVKLAVGDDVRLEREAGTDAWAICDILPRRSQLARREPGGRYGERVLVANVDQIVVVFAAARPDPHPRMLDRFLVIAEANGLAARVVINKVDLVDADDARARFAAYERLGYPMHFTSVKQRVGLEALHAAIAGRTSALTGPSGVGKSSLLNALYPGLDLRVGEVSEAVNKGRHTTVGALLHPLPSEGGEPRGFVADTPGLREVGAWGLAPERLDECFPEMRAVKDGCRFADCTHGVEPDCAVRAAVDDGRVSAERYDSYRRLREELEEEEKKWRYT